MPRPGSRPDTFLSVGIDPGAPGFRRAAYAQDTPPIRFYDLTDLTYVYQPGHGVAICGYNDNINPRGKDPTIGVAPDGELRGGALERGYAWLYLLSYAYVKRYIDMPMS